MGKDGIKVSNNEFEHKRNIKVNYLADNTVKKAEQGRYVSEKSNLSFLYRLIQRG